MSDDLRARALGDQVQAALNLDPDVIGFVVVIARPDGRGATLEVRSRVDRDEFESALARAFGEA